MKINLVHVILRNECMLFCENVNCCLVRNIFQSVSLPTLLIARIMLGYCITSLAYVLKLKLPCWHSLMRNIHASAAQASTNQASRNMSIIYQDYHHQPVMFADWQLCYQRKGVSQMRASSRRRLVRHSYHPGLRWCPD